MIGSGVGSRTGSGVGVLGGGVGSLGGSGVGSFGGSGVGTFGGSGVGTFSSFLTTLESTFNIWLGVVSESRRLALNRGRFVVLWQGELLRFRGTDHVYWRIITHSKLSCNFYATNLQRNDTVQNNSLLFSFSSFFSNFSRFFCLCCFHSFSWFLNDFVNNRYSDETTYLL